MKTLLLFTDISVNRETKIGYGAYLFLDNLCATSDLSEKIRLKKFKNTSSTKLELQTLLWAFQETEKYKGKFIIHTDSQNIIGLKDRRQRLEENNYLTKRNIPIKNYELYKEFFFMLDQIDAEFVKVTGHKSNKTKTNMDRIFSLVDKASRKALRGFIR